MMKRLTVMALAIVAGGLGAAEAPKEVAERNRGYVQAFSPSVTTVRYYLKRNADGEDPRLQVPYLCPNCNSTHFNPGDYDIEKKLPLQAVGFVVGEDRVIMQDLQLPGEIVERIAIVTPEGEVSAVEHERALEEDAVALKAEKPLKGLRPLEFSGVEPEHPRYFYLVRENGLTCSGVLESDIARFRHYAEPNCDAYSGHPNTIVTGDGDRAATLTFRKLQTVGEENFAAPSAWRWTPSAEVAARRQALQDRIRRGVFPVYIQLEAKAKNELNSRRIYFSGRDEAKNDIETIGVALGEGKVLVLARLEPDATARLQRMEATLADGSKQELRFVGSLRKYGALIASVGESPAMEPFSQASRPALGYFNRRVEAFGIMNRGGRLDMRGAVLHCCRFGRIEGGEIVPKFESLSGYRIDDYEERGSLHRLVFDETGALVMLALADRLESPRFGGRETLPVFGSRLSELADDSGFDDENVPRGGGDRHRVAWFGVETQSAGADILREKKAMSFLPGYIDRAAQVTAVATNSPAAAAGLATGDILVSVSHVGGAGKESIRMDDDYSSRIDWSDVFERSEFVDSMMLGGNAPWPSLEGGVNATFAQFGVGTEVEVAWVRDGRRMTGRCKLALAPVHFENAPRKRNSELGVTVCDMTDEVRQFFKMDAGASGVVVVKVKSGGPAAVAGLKPFEIVTDIDGVGIRDAKDFAAKIKDVRKFTLSVRRLTTTRVVPLDLSESSAQR